MENRCIETKWHFKKKKRKTSSLIMSLDRTNSSNKYFSIPSSLCTGTLGMCSQMISVNSMQSILSLMLCFSLPFSIRVLVLWYKKNDNALIWYIVFHCSFNHLVLSHSLQVHIELSIYSDTKIMIEEQKKMISFTFVLLKWFKLMGMRTYFAFLTHTHAFPLFFLFNRTRVHNSHIIHKYSFIFISLEFKNIYHGSYGTFLFFRYVIDILQ